MSINDSVQVHNDWDAAYYIIVFCELIPRTDTEDIRNPLLSSLILAAPVVALPVLHRGVDHIEVGQQQGVEAHLPGAYSTRTVSRKPVRPCLFPVSSFPSAQSAARQCSRSAAVPR